MRRACGTGQRCFVANHPSSRGPGWCAQARQHLLRALLVDTLWDGCLDTASNGVCVASSATTRGTPRWCTKVQGLGLQLPELHRERRGPRTQIAPWGPTASSPTGWTFSAWPEKTALRRASHAAAPLAGVALPAPGRVGRHSVAPQPPQTRDQNTATHSKTIAFAHQNQRFASRFFHQNPAARGTSTIARPVQAPTKELSRWLRASTGSI